MQLSQQQNRPWVEKYRPKNLDNIVYQDELVSALKKSLESSDFPNLLFYGPPGTGKTSSIIAFSKKMFGQQFEYRVLQLNASDDRGISVVRDRLRNFAQTMPVRSEGVPNLKLVILDEADSMTVAAQSCLRRIMETYSKTTRFCLICNYVSRIIEPIASRCSKFRFKPVTKKLIADRLKQICENEHVICPEDTLDHLISVSEGDLRQAITFLQSAHRLVGQGEITKEMISEISGYIPPKLLNKFIAKCLNASKNIDRIEEYIQELVNDGYTASQFLSQVHDLLLMNGRLTDDDLAKVIKSLALAEHRLCDGSDEYLQLLYVATTIFRCYVKS